jgi:hypothetical protein
MTWEYKFFKLFNDKETQPYVFYLLYITAPILFFFITVIKSKTFNSYLLNTYFSVYFKQVYSFLGGFLLLLWFINAISEYKRDKQFYWLNCRVAVLYLCTGFFLVIVCSLL